ncbi:coiled-coil domain-containing protein 112 [Sminthopsis crassicaudata]|uniref:coiled-coil domain-containing protein 112 n=1 Tax=Sminthopsis crassicaudata TaxID=9301 RepID=UPI003D699E75
MAALTTVVVAATAEAGTRTLATAISTAGQSQNDSFSGTQEGVRSFQLQNWKQKADQAKKIEFIRTAEKLKNQVANIEKDKNGHLYNKKNDFRIDFIVLEELEHKLVNNRKTERAQIQQHLAKMHNNVKRLQQQLKDVKSTPEFVEKLREMMEEIENAINTFKEDQRQIYEDLIKEEKITSNELNALEKKIETWALSNSRTERSFKVPSSRFSLDTVMLNNLPEEVVEFEKFLQQAGGRQGGWDDYDHQYFLKVRNKHKGKPSYMKEVLEYLPGRTEDEVQLHEKWYQKFLSLEERKKEFIQKWKAKKQQEKKEMLETKSEEILRSNDLQQEDSQKQKEEQRKKQKLAIEAWKKQKIVELSMKQTSQLKEEEEKERKQQKEHQRQSHLKLLLEKHTQQKKEQEELLKLEKEMKEKTEREERRKTALNEITKFQERDLHKLELKILERQAKKNEKIEKERRLAKLREKVEVNVSRDPSRLYKLTKGWEERTKERGPTGAGPLLNIPHRAIPTWRQGL